ncbi:helix-turn-helix domain-containing protein [[Kitasatospora] papulosa]|uniref:helix-turn-helix domain-containing protein n=1 Tax=Streptomyces TaxID=1883 RepID=UPI000691474B|nr:helix-turn-helix domain-containing protein [Streptomyces sp. NRRL S-325]
MLRTDKGRPDSTARHVLQVLAEHARPDGSNAHPSHLRIQYRTGYDERTIQRALRRLEAGGLIKSTGSVNGRRKWRLQLHLRRPAFDWAELEAEAEDAKKQAAERQRKSRQKRVTPPESVTVTDAESVTEPDVTHSASVSHALEVRDVTHSASECHALSAPLTTSQPSDNHQEPFHGPADASASAAAPTPGDTEDAPDDVVDGEVLEEPAAEKPETVTAQTIVGEWLERTPKRPPSSVIGQVSKTIRVLLEEDRIDPDDIRRGIATWMSKGLHPSTLPSVVNQVMNAGSTPQRPGPPTGETVFDRARARAAARAAQHQEGQTP